MATYDEKIDRTAVQTGDGPPGGLIPEDVVDQVIQHATENSAIMRNGRALQQGARGQLRMPVLDSLPHAYFVSGDTGFKETTKMKWRDTFVNYEELAAIVPIPDNVLNDAAYDLWAQVEEPLAEAIGLAFDQAVLYGTNAPSGYPDALLDKIDSAGHVVAYADGDSLFTKVLGDGGVLAQVEEDGYMVNGHIAALKLRGKLRGETDEQGQPIFKPLYQEGLQGGSRYELDGEPLDFPRNGSIDPDEALLVSGDWSELVHSVRQDMEWTVATQGVITDSDGTIIHNLFQQDMSALRVTFRVGWALPNPVNRVNPDGDTRLPFAALVPAAT